MAEDNIVSSSYITTYIPSSIRIELEAGAFRSLCRHLRDRADEVQNIDLMTLSGFCRNCLAKWMVLEARVISSSIKSGERDIVDDDDSLMRTVTILDTLGYNETAEEVYGCAYTDWKKRHQKKATDEQMEAFQRSESRWAKHEKNLIQPRAQKASNLLSENREGQTSYIAAHLPRSIRVRMESSAFRSVCRHLQRLSDEVPNMELMTLSGFCRNCLAKWLVMEARRMSDSMRTSDGDTSAGDRQNMHLLDAIGYEEAAEEVYGCTYADWKRRHQKKASDEQIEAFNASKALWASHDKTMLAPRAERTTVLASYEPISNIVLSMTRTDQHHSQSAAKQTKTSLLSDVCCQDVDSTRSKAVPVSSPYLEIPAPTGGIALLVGILTVSDRASANRYETGDLSGPAVEEAIKSEVARAGAGVTCTIVERSIVPDESEAIIDTLKTWSVDASGDSCNLIFTCGGTGFAQRDITPEATCKIVDRECRGLMSWASMKSSFEQPLATLSRGTAGIRGRCLIVNLPGNPKGAAQVTRLLLPLLLHAVADLQNTN